MFFRRAATKITTYEDRLGAARTAGFRTESIGGGKTRIERNGIAAVAESGEGGMPKFTVKAGVMMVDEPLVR